MPEDFAIQLTRWVAKQGSALDQIQQAVKDEVLNSVLNPSDITGSEGLPLDTKLLRDSWTWKETSRGRSELNSNCAYAGVIEFDDRGYWDPNGVWEKGDRPHTYERTGQRGSVRMTVAGWQQIVDAVAGGPSTRQNLRGLGSVG